MTAKTSEKNRARALQEQTRWSYSECLRCVRTMTEDEIDVLIEQRKSVAGQQKVPAAHQIKPDAKPVSSGDSVQRNEGGEAWCSLGIAFKSLRSGE